jgi:hypothetical protein
MSEKVSDMLVVFPEKLLPWTTSVPSFSIPPPSAAELPVKVLWSTVAVPVLTMPPPPSKTVLTMPPPPSNTI